jgi:hypothetical protein
MNSISQAFILPWHDSREFSLGPVQYNELRNPRKHLTYAIIKDYTQFFLKLEEGKKVSNFIQIDAIN